MKSWNVRIHYVNGHADRLTVDAGTRIAARVAGLYKRAREVHADGSALRGVARVTASPAGDPLRSLVRKLRGRMSGRMAYLMSGILGHDFGARDSHGNACGRLTVTSDGFALGAMGNAFLGAESDIRDNVRGLLAHVGATETETARAWTLYRERVKRC